MGGVGFNGATFDGALAGVYEESPNDGGGHDERAEDAELEANVIYQNLLYTFDLYMNVYSSHCWRQWMTSKMKRKRLRCGVIL